MKQNVEEQPVIVQIVNGPHRQYTFDESCIALTGMNVAWFVRELQRNRNGEFDDIFEDAGRSQDKNRTQGKARNRQGRLSYCAPKGAVASGQR